MSEKYKCKVDMHELNEKIINSGTGSCYALPSKSGNCKTCGFLDIKEA
jgi:hypothetical protein